MALYYVYTTETVSYCYKVEADSEEEARKAVYNGDYLDSDWVDSYGFEIAEIEKESE